MVSMLEQRTGPEGDKHRQHGLGGSAQQDPHAFPDLSKEQLEIVYAEADPVKKFELFAGILNAESGSEAEVDGVRQQPSSSPPTSIAIEYYFSNVMFCREQGFTAEQTSAFHRIARTVFEASIERGELDLDGAFKAFTDMMLAFAVVPENSSSTGTGSKGAADGRRENDAKPNAVGAPVGSDDPATGGENGAGVEGSKSSKAKAESNPSDGSNTVGPLFSVGDVAAITQFVARGLYRNFSLYRMCYLQRARHCKESRVLQVQTPLALEPLRNAELVAEAATSA